MGRKRKHRKDALSINLIEKIGIICAFLSIAEKILTMVLLEG